LYPTIPIYECMRRAMAMVASLIVGWSSKRGGGIVDFEQTGTPTTKLSVATFCRFNDHQCTFFTGT
jgi:hypothetical protein